MQGPIRALVAFGVLLAVAGCSGEPGTGGAVAQRGRQVYLAQCTACHSMDPSQPGPLGPPIKGSSRELLEARLLRGTYPPGYRPKSTTRLMPPQPALAGDVDALAAFLK